MALLGPSATGLASGSAEYAEDRDRPLPHNVILIVVDTLRADHLSQYGYTLDTSPALEPLVKASTLFTRAYSPSSWTVPATASLHTGVHPARHKVIRRGSSLNPKLHTLAEALKDEGYETFGVSYNLNVSRITKYHQGFETFLDYRGNLSAYPDITEMVDETLDWMARRQEKGEPRPFFLYLQPMNCHGPYRVPEAHRSVLLSRPPVSGFKYNSKIMRRIMWKGQIDKRKSVGPRYLRSLQEQYDTSIRYTTDEIGRLLGALVETGQFDNTLIVFTADHGEELFDHGGFTHGYTLYEEVVHVPLLIKMPGQKHASDSNALVSLMDIYPTVLEITGATFEHDIDGRSIGALLSGMRKKEHDHADARRNAPADRILSLQLMWRPRGRIKAVVSKRFKLIDVKKDYTRSGKAQYLFDLKTDPREEKDLSAYREKKRERLFQTLVKRFDEFTEKKAYKRPKNVLSSMKTEALKALGYVQ
jgi:arylsulfatase A-like enzyme